MALTLVLNDFSGPLDLLWHLIKENKIDIYDIPIAKITAQYMAYLRGMEARALDVAGDYFVMAASLMALKSRLLLPEPEPEGEDGFDEPADPRAALVAQLLNYQVFQEAAANLHQMEQDRGQLFSKPATLPPADVQAPLAPGAVKLRDLTAAMQKVLGRIQQTERAVRHIEAESISLDDKVAQIEQQLSQQHQCTFLSLVSMPTVTDVVTTFLALLEMARRQLITCTQEDRTQDLLINRREGEERHAG